MALIDDQFTSLSSLAQQYGKTDLRSLGQTSQPRDGVYLGLGDCCNDVLRGVKRVPSPRCDSYNYLATIDALAELSNNLEKEILWNKIKDAKTFLNTVVEATWVVYFLSHGLSLRTDVPLNPLEPKGKNADLVVVLKSKKYWLDALSVDLGESPFFIEPSSTKHPRPLGKHGSLLGELVKRARRKYKRKFWEAICSGTVQDSVGVLLCVLKSEPYVMPYLSAFDSSPPSRLFGADAPRFDVVIVHTLRDDQNSNVLKPHILLNWQYQADVHNSVQF